MGMVKIFLVLFSLTPALSPRRGRVVASLFEKSQD
jgi:hypothetical protein